MVWRHVSSFASSALGLQLYSPSSSASITATTAKFNSRGGPCPTTFAVRTLR
jgi:hypothetical protein